MSGGIDSPVAAYLMMKNGAEVIALHLDNRPFTDEKQLNKTISQLKHLEKVTNTTIKTYIAPHGDTQLAFAQECRHNLQCVLCRRMMFRVAERLAKQEGASAIVTGESLGQVASQTLKNIMVETEAVKIPILRPLIGLDKIEIERIAQEIGTFEISISPGVCCTIVPNKPSTRANLKSIKAEESKVDLNSLLENTINNMKME